MGKVRWWHVVVGRPTSPVTKTDVSLAIHSFFPSRAIVMQVHLPDEDLDDDEVQGFIVHLWWAVDGNAGVPAVSEWQGAEGFEEPEMAPTWE